MTRTPTNLKGLFGYKGRSQRFVKNIFDKWILWDPGIRFDKFLSLKNAQKADGRGDLQKKAMHLRECDWKTTWMSQEVRINGW